MSECIFVLGIVPDTHAHAPAHAQLQQISRQVGAQGEEPRAVLWFLEVVLWISVLHAVVTNTCENLKLQARLPFSLRGGVPFLARERGLILGKRIVEEAGWGAGDAEEATRHVAKLSVRLGELEAYRAGR